MFNMLLLNSIRMDYKDRGTNSLGLNVIIYAMWFYGLIQPMLYYAVMKGFEYFVFQLPYWAWIICSLILILDQLNVVAMFRIRNVADTGNGIPWYLNLGKSRSTDDVGSLILYLLSAIASIVVVSTILMETPPFTFWLVLFSATTVVMIYFYELSKAKDSYYRHRQSLMENDCDNKFACDKKD